MHVYVCTCFCVCNNLSLFHCLSINLPFTLQLYLLLSRFMLHYFHIYCSITFILSNFINYLSLQFCDFFLFNFILNNFIIYLSFHFCAFFLLFHLSINPPFLFYLVLYLFYPIFLLIHHSISSPIFLHVPINYIFYLSYLFFVLFLFLLLLAKMFHEWKRFV